MTECQHACFRKFKFFRILLNDFKTKLAIPQRLTSYLIKENLTLVTLLSPLGKSWNVQIGGDTKGLHFAEGWERFAAAHGLSFGELLVFEYIGGIVFQVTIFDKSTCEKEHYKATNGIAGEDVPAGDQVENSEKECSRGNVKEQTTPSCGRRTPPAVKQQESKIKGLQNPVHHKAKEATDQRSSHFEITISPKCKYAGTVPAKFVRSNDLSGFHQVLLMVDPPGGRLWPIRLIHRKDSIGCDRHLLLSKGWRDFCIHHNLKDGDVCIFELKKKNKMLVQIRRSCEGSSRRSKSALQHAPVLKREALVESKGSPSKVIASTSQRADPILHQFKSTIVPSNIAKDAGYMTIPSAFRLLVDLSAEKEVVLVDPSSRQWRLKIYYNEERRWCRIGHGWVAFCKENDVEVGDVCIFNFEYRGREATFKVELIKC